MQNKTTHNAEYMQALFSAMLWIIEQSATVASNTNRLRLIQSLAQIGYEGVVVGSGVEDFDEAVISEWLADIEAGSH